MTAPASPLHPHPADHGRGVDEAIDTVLARGFAQVVTTGSRMARIAGHLLAEVDAGIEMAIDAIVVATAVRFGGGHRGHPRP